MCREKLCGGLVMSSIPSLHVLDWSNEDVGEWLVKRGHGKYISLFKQHIIDGKALLLMNESDLRSPPLEIQCLGDVKRLSWDIRQLKMESRQSLIEHGFDPSNLLFLPRLHSSGVIKSDVDQLLSQYRSGCTDMPNSEYEYPHSNPSSEDGHASQLRPEMWKALIALTYLFVVTWITAFVMVIVHDRVPDMKRYPPLPDIFLDNVPHIPWAFHMCEWTGTLLLAIWLCVLFFHKHRFILLRRFFALSGTVFLLRCITMLITSLSVPGTHLECTPRSPSNSEESPFIDVLTKMKQAYIIWKGAGMSIQGVRTCGDYMFSGHTVALTMLNFFITEYTPRDIYLLHTFSWLLNMFGIFFILSGHEHYSIDVFIAFYITSRLFLYYHTLANNQSLMQRDTGRTRIWFPLFSFFESDVDGIVPNEYESPVVLLRRFSNGIKHSYRKVAYLFPHNIISTQHTSSSASCHGTQSHNNASLRKNKRKPL